MGERIQEGTGEGRQGNMDSLSLRSYIPWPEAHLPLEMRGAGKVAGSRWRVAGSRDEDQRQ